MVAGTPLRIRAAIGTIAGQTVNRWYVIQRNAQEWPEEIDEAYRRWSPATGTDIWAALSATGPTPYRGEVYDDGPYAWWPCDDQPGEANVLPDDAAERGTGEHEHAEHLPVPERGDLSSFTTPRTGHQRAA